MKREEIKKLIIESLSKDEDAGESGRKLEEAGVSYSFADDFREKVMDRLFTAGIVVNREVEFMRSWNSAFFRIALTGVAAIVILLISLYLVEGSFTLNGMLGLSDNYDESIVCLLTGN
ncbi:MAG: hypothetical protein ABR974_10400 [Bacteroidales bacterium]|jgi:hypothetical protein